MLSLLIEMGEVTCCPAPRFVLNSLMPSTVGALLAFGDWRSYSVMLGNSCLGKTFHEVAPQASDLVAK